MPEKYIGIMCGTSLDSLDLCICNFDKTAKVELFKSYRLSQSLRDKINLCKKKPSNKKIFEDTDHEFTLFLVSCVNKLVCSINKQNIMAIGFPGITIVHKPKTRISLTLGDPRKIAEATGIRVVADFRIADMKVGGQGAPLAAYFHDFISSKEKNFINIINLGGFANLTYKSHQRLMAFDTGPANYLIDMISKKYFKQDYDKNGLLAKNGIVNYDALKAMLADKYFNLDPPKSTGFEKFNLRWLDKFIKKFRLNRNSLIATVTELTSISISDAINTCDLDSVYIFFAGGGSRNSVIRKEVLKRTGMIDIKKLPWGLDYQNLESCAFAWLAMKRVKGEMITNGYVTGARKSRKLGIIYP